MFLVFFLSFAFYFWLFKPKQERRSVSTGGRTAPPPPDRRGAPIKSKSRKGFGTTALSYCALLELTATSDSPQPQISSSSSNWPPLGGDASGTCGTISRLSLVSTTLPAAPVVRENVTSFLWTVPALATFEDVGFEYSVCTPYNLQNHMYHPPSTLTNIATSRQS